MTWFSSVVIVVLVTVLAPAVDAAGAEASRIEEAFRDPPMEYAPAAFWFWMDDLEPGSLVAQLESMRAKGVGGVCIHPRIGLSREVGYLTPLWFERVRLAVQTAKRLGMTVWLYDEGMYPSGAAGGLVVQGNPEFRCQALIARQEAIEGPRQLPSLPVDRRTPEETWVATWAYHEGTQEWSDLSARVRAKEAWDVPPGPNRLVTILKVYLNTQIRGLGFGPRPLAADLLNPDAMDKFIRLTHERCREACGDEFGKTILGIFTDEPSLHGRGTGGYREIRSWTDRFPGFFHELIGYDIATVLPALWFDFGPRTETIRLDYHRAIDALFDRSYYGKLSAWCEKAGIALTGHPAGFGEIGHLRYFHVPGQDIVWRQVTPEKASSILGKVGSSAAHIYGRRRNMNEVLGAYGWELSPREVKWLSDWLCVRGVDLHMLHAFYSSLEGDRKHERPPDVGFGNLWWDEYRQYSDYVRRLCYAITRGRPAIRVAVYDHRNRSVEKVPFWLLQSQRDFDYLEARVLEDECRIEGGSLRIHDSAYDLLVLEDVSRIAPASLRRIAEFKRAGGAVLAWGRLPEDADREGYTDEVKSLVAAIWDGKSDRALRVEGGREDVARAVDRWIPPDVIIDPPSVDLRALHRRLPDGDLYLLVNESIARPISGMVTLEGDGVPVNLDPGTGAAEVLSCYGRLAGGGEGKAQGESPAVQRPRIRFPVDVDPYESQLVAILRGREEPLHIVETNLRHVRRDGKAFTGRLESGRKATALLSNDRRFETVVAEPEPPRVLDGGWRIEGRPGADPSGEWPIPEGGLEIGRPKPWTEVHEKLKLFSGTLTYVCDMDVPAKYLDQGLGLEIDIGEVAEFAGVSLNGRDLGTKLWPPFRWEITGIAQAGSNRIEIRVTNTLKNRYDREPLRSGLIGPVTLRSFARVRI